MLQLAAAAVGVDAELRVDQLAYLRSSWPELDTFLRTGGSRLRVEPLAPNAASGEESKDDDENEEEGGARLLRELPGGRSA